MAIFAEYARFYDSYYSSKDYSDEVKYVLDLVDGMSQKEVSEVLDLGCGTGKHVVSFAEKGINVAGIDLSPKMISIAKANIADKGLGNLAKVDVGDIRTHRQGEKFDLVVSMFAVMGYLTSNDDFLAGLQTARMHMKDDGLFVFDVWYGPTVLSRLPEVRIQEFEQDGARVIRLVKPSVDVPANTVDVNYRILEIDGQQIRGEVTETHKMRYFFKKELELFAKLAGMELAAFHPFMNLHDEPKLGDWNITVALRKNGRLNS